MKAKSFSLIRYDSSPGLCFDWAEPRYVDVPNDKDNPEAGTHQEQEHLYAKTIFVGGNDSIDNYIEVAEPAGQNN